MRGYKIFGSDYTCRGYKYSLEGVNTDPNQKMIKPCFSGFHYCLEAIDCLKYYNYDPAYTYAEVECVGDYIVEKDKVVCRHLQIIRTITYEEFGELLTYEIDTPTKKCSYLRGRLHGPCKFYVNVWNKTVQIVDANYKDGKLDGKYTEWYSSGKLKIETNYVDGKLHGDWKTWCHYGYLTQHKKYKDGIILNCTSWNNKNISKYVEYDNNGVISFVKWWYPNGKVWRENNYVDGKLHGFTREWSNSGNLIREVIYHNDIIVSDKKWWDSENKILEYEKTYTHGNQSVVYTEYYCDGSLHIYSNYKDEKLNGRYRKWHINGRLLEDKNYLNGKKHGSFKEWSKSGNLTTNKNYINGKTSNIGNH